MTPDSQALIRPLSTVPKIRACGCPYDGHKLCDVHGDGTGYCGACGHYAPMTLDGSARVHHCDRTPPLDGLPPNICVCPVCFGHGASRWGCWGTQERPHAHAYMRPLRDVIQDRCECVARCGEGDPEGPGVCKGLPRA